MSRPDAIPTWATDANYSNGPQPGTPTKVTPPLGKAAEGWVPTEKPAAQYQNWFQNRAGGWLAHLASMLLARGDLWYTKTGFVAEDNVNGTKNIACLPSLSTVDGDPWVMVDGDIILSSKQGNAWTSRAHTAFTAFSRGVFGLDPCGVFLAFDDDGLIRRSVDGITWTDPTNPVAATAVLDVACNEDGSLIVGCCGTTADGFITSDDEGATWTSVDSGAAAVIQKVTWTGVLWLGLGANVCVTSETGIAWTARTSPVNATKLGLAANVRTGVALATSTTDDTIYRTTDGVTWETLDAPGVTGENHHGIVCVDGVFLLLRGTTCPVWYSVDDGDTWYQVFGPLLECSGVAHGQGGFLIVAPDGADTVIFTTPKAPW